ncbi:MAG: hypothetical protein ACRDTN_10070 [Mycobacterium sp.]
MGKTVDPARLADIVRDYRFAYLITVDDEYRTRATTVMPTYDGAGFDVGPVGRHRRASLAQHRDVTLVWPPHEVNQYSLIVDGEAELFDDPTASVRVTPKRALLHRPVFTDDTESATSGISDCVEITEA